MVWASVLGPIAKNLADIIDYYATLVENAKQAADNMRKEATDVGLSNSSDEIVSPYLNPAIEYDEYVRELSQEMDLNDPNIRNEFNKAVQEKADLWNQWIVYVGAAKAWGRIARELNEAADGIKAHEDTVVNFCVPDWKSVMVSALWESFDWQNDRTLLLIERHKARAASSRCAKNAALLLQEADDMSISKGLRILGKFGGPVSDIGGILYDGFSGNESWKQAFFSGGMGAAAGAAATALVVMVVGNPITLGGAACLAVLGAAVSSILNRSIDQGWGPLPYTEEPALPWDEPGIMEVANNRLAITYAEAVGKPVFRY
jgi:hypothetical protein